MKIGYFSDIHLDHSPYFFDPDEFPDIDVWINAGDTATNPLMYDYFHSLFKGKKYFYIDGNHDFYKREIKDPFSYITIGEFDGITIVGATLWTDLTHPLDWMNYVHGLVDYGHMKNQDWTHAKYMEHHNTHVHFLKNCGADIIFTHHAPSFKSVSKEFEGDSLNNCFASNLEEMIHTMNKPPKYWFHGHMHRPARYKIGETTVICHPRGYPNENLYYRTYMPLIMDF